MSSRNNRWVVAGLLLGLLPGPFAFAQSAAPRHDAKLQKSIDSLVAGFDGTVGIYVWNLKNGKSAEIRADELFPTASMVKVPILIGVYDRINQGLLRFDSTLVYTDSLADNEGGDILGSFKDSTKIEVSRVIMLMITTSDNTAALWNQYLAGTGTTINNWLSSHGFDSTRVNSRTPGRQDNRKNYGWGQTTPREMARLLVMIREGKAVSPAASEEMYRDLTRIYWNGESLSQLPPWVQAASKQGFVDASRSEVVLVNAPSGDYVFCIITKNQGDHSYIHANPGFVLIRQLSALLWRTFEPKHPWKPSPGAAELKPTSE
ncbi:MAG: serine hydrolase [Gemmatimonadota bacterium]